MSTITLNPVLQVRRVFDASPEDLFDAWFDREQWQAWIGPEGCQCDVPLLEPKVGGRYRIDMHLSDGREMPVEGEFKIIDRPRSLAFTWNWPLSETSTLVRLSFKAVADGTELTLTHEGVLKAEDREGYGKGWNGTLNKLGRYLNGETP